MKPVYDDAYFKMTINLLRPIIVVTRACSRVKTSSLMAESLNRLARVEEEEKEEQQQQGAGRAMVAAWPVQVLLMMFLLFLLKLIA